MASKKGCLVPLACSSAIIKKAYEEQERKAAVNATCSPLLSWSGHWDLSSSASNRYGEFSLWAALRVGVRHTLMAAGFMVTLKGYSTLSRR